MGNSYFQVTVQNDYFCKSNCYFLSITCSHQRITKGNGERKVTVIFRFVLRIGAINLRINVIFGERQVVSKKVFTLADENRVEN